MISPLRIGTRELLFKGPTCSISTACVKQTRGWFCKTPDLFGNRNYIEIPSLYYSDITKLVDIKPDHSCFKPNINLEYINVLEYDDGYGGNDSITKITHNLTLSLLETVRNKSKVYIHLNFEGWNLHYLDIDKTFSISQLPSSNIGGVIVESSPNKHWVLLDLFTKNYWLYGSDTFKEISIVDSSWLHHASWKNRIRGYKKHKFTPTIIDAFNEDKMSLTFHKFLIKFEEHWKNV